MSIEQREHQRYQIAVSGEIELGGETVGVSTDNLSSGGVALILGLPVDDGTTLAVTLLLTQDGIEDPDEEPFEAKGVVRWTAETDDGRRLVGLQFVPLTPAQKKQLERFLVAVG